jgi:diguanylate cyclase (GGDEF)-like protein
VKAPAPAGRQLCHRMWQAAGPFGPSKPPAGAILEPPGLSYSQSMNTPAPVRRALYRALHDPLTGLATRGLLLDQVNQALDRSGRRSSGWVAVLALDLDRFRLVNDALGHPAGDELLVEVARRLEGVLRSTDTAARLGGDEFVVLADDLDCEGEATALAGRLREVIAAPVRLSSGEQVVVTSSVGIALAGPGPQSPAALLWDADAALYRAKECGRD